MKPVWLNEILDNEIRQPIRSDQRTTPGNPLGYPSERIFHDVIDGGQANFDTPIAHLSGADRALLYAHFNQERHLDELSHAFRKLFGSAGQVRRPTVIDMGCGPFTAGLALAVQLGPSQPFRYFGIDRSTEMLALGRQLHAAARQKRTLHPLTEVNFGANLDTVDFGPVRGELALVVASYLLASPTIDANRLAASILDALGRIGHGPAAVFYTNSALSHNSTKFPPFRVALNAAGFTVVQNDVELFDDTDKKPGKVHYALFFRPPKTTL